MINTRKFSEMARMGKKIVAIGRRRISLGRNEDTADSSRCTTSVANKGHFVAYTTDGTRFVISLEYLSSYVFQELFKMSEDEFGLPHGGPITLPCDAVFVEYAMSLIGRNASKDMEKAFLASLASAGCSRSLSPYEGPLDQHALLSGFCRRCQVDC